MWELIDVGRTWLLQTILYPPFHIPLQGERLAVISGHGLGL
jgi:hypothetical protein